MQSWEMDLAEREVSLPPSKALVRVCPANSSGRASCQWKRCGGAQRDRIRKLIVSTVCRGQCVRAPCHRMGTWAGRAAGRESVSPSVMPWKHCHSQPGKPLPWCEGTPGAGWRLARRR